MNPIEHHRRSIRLPTYNYSQEGYYFVTICTHNRNSYFGNLDRNGIMRLSFMGKIVQNGWFKIPEHFQNVKLDKYVIMPNHLHGIIGISVGAIHELPLQ